MRAPVIQAWQLVYPGYEPSLAEIQYLQAQGAWEGWYGRGWGRRVSPVSGRETDMADSHNWGSVQCKSKPVDGVCPEGCGFWFDSRPTAQGQKYYDWCYKKYPDDAHGAAGILEVLKHFPKVMDVLPGGNLDEIAWQMRLGGYYEGFTTDKRQAARDYAAGLQKMVDEISSAMGEEEEAYRMGEEGQSRFDNEGVAGGLPAPLKIAAGGVAVLGAGALVGKLVRWWLG